MLEPITNEEFDLLTLRLDNIRAAMGVGNIDEMNEDGSPFALIYLAMTNWIRSTHLASEVSRAATALDMSQLEQVTATIHQHVGLLRAALSQAEKLIAES